VLLKNVATRHFERALNLECGGLPPLLTPTQWLSMKIGQQPRHFERSETRWPSARFLRGEISLQRFSVSSTAAFLGGSYEYIKRFAFHRTN
jgi:hypothetical protein